MEVPSHVNEQPDFKQESNSLKSVLEEWCTVCSYDVPSHEPSFLGKPLRPSGLLCSGVSMIQTLEHPSLEPASLSNVVRASEASHWVIMH
jgi:hypothetical protein